MNDKQAWTNARSVIQAKIQNVQNELMELREKTIAKQNELMGLRDGLSSIDRFIPKD